VRLRVHDHFLAHTAWYKPRHDPDYPAGG